MKLKDTKGKKGSGISRTHPAAPDQEPEPTSAMVDLMAGVKAAASCRHGCWESFVSKRV